MAWVNAAILNLLEGDRREFTVSEIYRTLGASRSAVNRALHILKADGAVVMGRGLRQKLVVAAAGVEISEVGDRRSRAQVLREVLQDKKPHTTADLARRVGCSRTMVLRIVGDLCDAGEAKRVRDHRWKAGGVLRWLVMAADVVHKPGPVKANHGKGEKVSRDGFEPWDAFGPFYLEPPSPAVRKRAERKVRSWFPRADPPRSR